MTETTMKVAIDALHQRMTNAETRLDQTTRATVGEAQIRRTALELATKHGSSTPGRFVGLAAEFEAYLTYGSPAPIPGPLLPPDLVEQATKVPADTLYAVQLILAERRRQTGKDYDALHDDGHTDGRMAFEAAAAIMPLGSSLLHPMHGPDFSSPDFEPWIDASVSRPRADVLVEGIALALAELERLHRWNQAENDRRATSEATMRDRMNLAALNPDAARKAEGLPPLVGEYGDENGVIRSTTLDTEQPAKQYHAPLGEALSGKRADTIIVDGLDDQAVTPIIDHFDLEKMHHAIGRPRNPLKETHRNRYSTPGDTLLAERFRELPAYWEESGGDGSGGDGSDRHGKAMRFFHVTQAGREALANAIQAGAALFRFELENGDAEGDVA